MIYGSGSGLQQTARLRAGLPRFLAQLGVRTLLDPPCRDFHWMRTVDFGIEDYTGVDILDEVIAAHQWRHAGPGRLFLRLDLMQDELPRADAMHEST